VLVLGACARPGAPAAPPPAAAAASVPAALGEAHLRNIRQLTFGGNNAEAYFSRSGTQLIFQRQEQLDAGCDQQYVMNVDGSGLRRVSNGKGRTTCGYFYDGDRRVLFSSSHAASPDCPPPPDRSHGYVWPLNELEIYTARPDGSDLRALTHFGGYNAEATVSPDGSRIVFTSTKDGDLELYTMRTDGSDVRRITRRVGYDGGSFFSPDGKSLVWRAWYPETARDSSEYLDLLRRHLVKPARMELWMADADGANARQVTQLGGANFAPFFTPDGRRIIFSSNYRNPRSRNFDLFIVGTDGQGLEQVTFDPEFDGFPMFSPDGRHLVWGSNRNAKVMGETNLFIADWVP
jgi:Tol biopolymer transport system component